MFLEDKGADVRIKDDNNRSLLFLAIENNRQNIVIYLTKKIHFNEHDGLGFTPLIYSVICEFYNKKSPGSSLYM